MKHIGKLRPPKHSSLRKKRLGGVCSLMFFGGFSGSSDQTLTLIHRFVSPKTI